MNCHPDKIIEHIDDLSCRSRQIMKQCVSAELADGVS